MKVVTGAFKATFFPILDIEFFILLIHPKLDQLSYKLLLREMSSQYYKTIVLQWSKVSKIKDISFLKTFSCQFKKRFEFKIEQIKQILLFINFLW